MPLLHPLVRKRLNEIKQAIGGAESEVQQIPDVVDVIDTIAQIPELRRSLRRELRDVLELIDGGQHPALAGVAGLREAVLDALQQLRIPGGPPVIQDDTDG